MVYSKGVLNHVRDKESLFQQVHSVLKPAGLFVITDWIFPEASTSNSGPLVCETTETYKQVLISAGFHDTEFRDDSAHFITYAKTLLKNITKHPSYIEESYGPETYSSIIKEHENLITKINQNKKFATRIVAVK